MLKNLSVQITSENSEELISFYTKVLGESVWKSEEGNFVAFKAGGGIVFVGPHSEVSGSNNQPARVMVQFEADDVQAEFDRIVDAGATSVQGPYHPDGNPEMWLSTLSDPDGNYIQIASSMGL